VWAEGAGLIATYSVDPDPSQGVTALLDFQFGDWLGTHRVLTDSNIQCGKAVPGASSSRCAGAGMRAESC